LGKIFTAYKKGVRRIGVTEKMSFSVSTAEGKLPLPFTVYDLIIFSWHCNVSKVLEDICVSWHATRSVWHPFDQEGCCHPYWSRNRYGARVGGSKTLKRNILRVFTMSDLLNI
jgi:hypothetical protein